MPPLELIELYAASLRLASKWDIPSSVAEQIVRAVLQSGDCFVRGRGPGDIGPRKISNDIAMALARETGLPGSGMIPWGFSDVEIEWECLLEQGRNLVPREYEYWVSAAEDAEYTTLKSGDERKAAALLAERLRTDPYMKVSDALDICQRQFPGLKERAIRQRVWPQARVAANLEPTAPPGPKPKMNRQPKQNRRA